MRVAALTQGRFVPAARFRVRQNIPTLKKFGVEVTEYYPDINVYQGVPCNMEGWPRPARLPLVAAWQALKLGLRIPHIYQAGKYDITLLQRELLPGYFTLEGLLKSPLVFDVDDAVWLSGINAARHVAKIAGHATSIFAGNNYIAEWFSSFNNRVVVIPTAVDVERFSPAADKYAECFTVGWIGTKANLQYLEQIAPALNIFLQKHTDAEFLVISDQAPALPNLPQKQLRYLPWSEQVEVEAIQQMDVGIMPLREDEWTKGKCSFKMLQYMACGVPVIVSPVGMNNTVLGFGNVGLGASTVDEWFDAMEFLYQNQTAGREMGVCGRDVVKKNFSTDVVAQAMAEACKAIM
jgi:glycosyltransferase involved in cell wall biosynthesis